MDIVAESKVEEYFAAKARTVEEGDLEIPVAPHRCNLPSPLTDDRYRSCRRLRLPEGTVWVCPCGNRFELAIEPTIGNLYYVPFWYRQRLSQPTNTVRIDSILARMFFVGGTVLVTLGVLLSLVPLMLPGSSLLLGSSWYTYRWSTGRKTPPQPSTYVRAEKLRRYDDIFWRERADIKRTEDCVLLEAGFMD